MAMSKKEMIKEAVGWFKYYAEMVLEWKESNYESKITLSKESYTSAIGVKNVLAAMEVITPESADYIVSVMIDALYDGRQNITITIHGIEINI